MPFPVDFPARGSELPSPSIRKGRQMAQTPESGLAKPGDAAHFAESSARENLIEHVFLGELLRGLWRKNIRDLEVLRPEVDSGGYDLALEFRGVSRERLASFCRGSASRSRPQAAKRWRVLATALMDWRWSGHFAASGLARIFARYESDGALIVDAVGVLSKTYGRPILATSPQPQPPQPHAPGRRRRF